MVEAVGAESDAYQDLRTQTVETSDRGHGDGVLDRVAKALLVPGHQRVGAAVDEDDRIHGVGVDELAIEPRQSRHRERSCVVRVHEVRRRLGMTRVEERAHVYLRRVVRVRRVGRGHPLGDSILLLEHDRRATADLARIAKRVAADDNLLAEPFQLRKEQESVHEVKAATAAAQQDVADGRVAQPTKETWGHGSMLSPGSGQERPNPTTAERESGWVTYFWGIGGARHCAATH